MQIGVHLGFEYGQRAKAGKFGGMSVEGEGAGDQHVVAVALGFGGGGEQIGLGQRAEFGADQDGGAALLLAFRVNGLGADVLARLGGAAGDGIEANGVALFHLVHAGGA